MQNIQSLRVRYASPFYLEERGEEKQQYLLTILIPMSEGQKGHYTPQIYEKEKNEEKYTKWHYNQVEAVDVLR